MAKAAQYTVTESFIGNLNGAEVEYHKGEVVDADDPAVKKMAGHFEPLVIRGHERAVEQATAEPGKKRRLYRRKPKAAPKDEPEPEPEPDPEPKGHALTTADLKGK
jgi:hypothetical protein